MGEGQSVAPSLRLMQRIIDAQPESPVGARGKPSGGALSRGLGSGLLGAGGGGGGSAGGGGGGGGAGGGGGSGKKSKDEILVTLEEDNGLLKLLVDVRHWSRALFHKKKSASYSKSISLSVA